VDDFDIEMALSRASHTPGPWHFNAQRGAVVANDRVLIHDGALDRNDPDNIRHYGGPLVCESVLRRDASLLVAAPRLLAACAAALSEDSGLACAPELRAAILAALGLS
jgi:hypothetical protein